MATKVDHLAAWVSPRVRFAWGLVLMLSLTLTTQWSLRWVIITQALVLAQGAGKRIKGLFFVSLVATVTFFHLLLPFGKVWLMVGSWPITEGAALDGLEKGLTLCGLVFISLFSVSRHLRLPGRLGSVWAQTFAWYEQLLEQKKHLQPRALLLSLDRLLERLYPTRTPQTEFTHRTLTTAVTQRKTTAGGWGLVGISLFSLAFVSWIRL